MGDKRMKRKGAQVKLWSHSPKFQRAIACGRTLMKMPIRGAIQEPCAQGLIVSRKVSKIPQAC